MKRAKYKAASEPYQTLAKCIRFEKKEKGEKKRKKKKRKKGKKKGKRKKEKTSIVREIL